MKILLLYRNIEPKQQTRKIRTYVKSKQVNLQKLEPYNKINTFTTFQSQRNTRYHHKKSTLLKGNKSYNTDFKKKVNLKHSQEEKYQIM